MVANQRLEAARAVAALLDATLAETWGALSDEFGASAVLTAARHRLIRPVLPGIYARSGTENHLRVRARALTVWAAPTGTVTGFAAAHLWGIVDTAPSRVTVQVLPEWHLKGPGWVRPLRVGSAQRRFRLGGIVLASAPDAVIQCWREGRPDVAAATVIAAVQRNKATASDLREALVRRKRIPRRAELEEMLSVVGTSVTSYLEYIARRDVFPPRDFPQLQWQQEVWPRGRRRVMDAFDPEAMLDIEFDGRGSHGGEDSFERDRERDNDMRTLGLEPLRYTYRDLTERPAWCRANYLAVREARLRQIRGARP